MTARPSPFAAELVRIAHEAGLLILKHYANKAEARIKADASPGPVDLSLKAADRKSTRLNSSHT